MHGHPAGLGQVGRHSRTDYIKNGPRWRSPR
jgi:hypothetical protein